MVFLIIAHPAINQTTHNNIFTLTPSPSPLLPFFQTLLKKFFLKKNREVDNQRERSRRGGARGRYKQRPAHDGFSRLY